MASWQEDVQNAMNELAGAITAGATKVDAGGFVIEADIIDADMNAITGTAPNNATLFDLEALLTTIDADTADGQVLSHRITGIYFSRPLVVDAEDFAAFQPIAVQEILGFFLGQFFRIHILFVEWIHVLVESSGCNGIPVCLDLGDQLCKPNGLNGFVKVAGRPGRHSGTNVADFFKLRLSLLICFCLRHFAS